MLGYRLGGRFVFEDVFHLAIGIALWIVYSWLQADLVKDCVQLAASRSGDHRGKQRKLDTSHGNSVV